MLYTHLPERAMNFYRIFPKFGGADATLVVPSGRNCRTACYNVPLVLGTPDIRESASTAIRNARAADLKIASEIWWLLRP